MLQLKTRIFEIYDRENKDLDKLATALGISIDQLHGIRKGTKSIDREFIIGVRRVFPEYNLADLFYLSLDASQTPENNNGLLEEDDTRTSTPHKGGD